MKQIRYIIEAFFAIPLYAILRILPLSVASAFGGSVARFFGPRSGVNRIAVRNLNHAMAHLSDEEKETVLQRMWDNLGRVFTEYPHLNSRTMMKRMEQINGLEHLQAAQASGRPVVLISGHFGNWELCPVVAADQGNPVHLLYRRANNPIIEYLIALVRRPYTRGLHSKGKAAARALVQAINRREPIGMLVDQKDNDGISVNFMGEPAMTQTITAQVVTKYDAVILPARCTRLNGCRFRMDVEAPINFNLTGDRQADTQHIMQQVHATLERWIHEDPAQWFWVHKRWPYSKKSDKAKLAKQAA